MSNLAPRWIVMLAGAMLLALSAACAAEPEVVTVEKEIVVEKEVVKEVPVEVVVEKEVVREVPVEKVVVKEVPVEKIVKEIVEVEKEVVKEVPVEVVVKEEVVKIVEVEKPVIVREEVVREVEVPVEKLVIEQIEVVKDLGWLPRAKEPNPKTGGVIRMSAPHRIAHFDFHQGAAAYAGQTSLYNNLVYYNQADGLKTITPDLASAWDISADGKTYTFTLREGVKWHDGVDFSAADVVATFNRIIDPPGGLAITASGLYEPVDKVEAIDPLTVRFSLKRPTPWFIEILAADNYFNPAVIYPKHFMEANGFDLRDEVAPGTGAFKLVDIRQDEYWDLEANPDYFVPYLPYADGARLVNVLPFCDRGTAVLTGQADFTWNTCGDVIKIALERPEFDAKYATGDIFFMTRGWNNEKAPFDDPRVRRAVHLAFDRDVFTDIYLAADGKTYPRSTWVPYYDTANALPRDVLMARPGYRSDKTEDIAEARRLMADAGYADGVEVELVTSTGAAGLSPFAAAMQSMFKDSLNITIKIREVDRLEVGGICESGDFTLGPAACGITGVPTIDITPAWNNTLVCNAPSNFSRYCNPDFDAVVAKLNVELDPVERYDLFRQAEDMLDANPPMLWVGGDQVDPMWARYFKGLDLHARDWGQWGRFETGWLDR